MHFGERMRQAESHDKLQVRLVYGSRCMDIVCRLRAAHVVHQTRILRHLPAAGLMLDIGSGYGHVGEVISRNAPGRSCVLMEPDHGPSPRVRRRTARNSCWPLRGDGRHMPFGDAMFDAAWALFVLHHVEFADQAAILSEVSRVMRPGGVFVLAEDTPRTLDEYANAVRADERINFEPAGAPHNYRNADDWRSELRTRGFAVVDEFPVTWLGPPVTWWPVPHWVYVCRRQP
jgi:ubiquinone/menaquinone biosynthesis C-methylase UbiE